MSAPTIILAADERDAREAARNLGIDYWLFPTTSGDLREIDVRRVVYVDGWRTSPTITTAIMDHLRYTMTPDCEEIEQPTTEAFLTAEQRAYHAQIILDHGRLDRRRPAAPFIAPEAWLAPRHARRPSRWQRFLAWFRA